MFQFCLSAGSERVIMLREQNALWCHLSGIGLEQWATELKRQSTGWFLPESHGTMSKWLAAYHALPDPVSSSVRVMVEHVAIKSESTFEKSALREALMQLHPWRKGPFDFLGVEIDSEWRSDLKWNRLASHIDFDGKAVLDVGCGNGYYGWRMLSQGAAFVLGCDPTLLYLMQFEAVRRYAQQPQRHFILPLSDSKLPEKLLAFDIAFSMGVFYHRISPIEHLQKMRSTIKRNGELILETLVIAGEQPEVLTPHGRYAKMRNVWCIPTVALLNTWLHRTGFGDIELLDLSRTTPDEQRSTDWMTFESLPDFLDSADSSRTIEGYPAPLRAVLRARAA